MEVPEVMPTSFGEPHFPPPREGTGTGKKTRKTKGKLRKLKKQQAAAEKAALKNKDVKSEVSDENSKTDKPLSDPDTRIEGNGTEEGVDASVEPNPHTSNTSVEQVSGGTEADKTCGEVNVSGESQAKKPRVRENPWDPLMPSFRVTCLRHGDKHNFDSMTAAANFGGAIYNYFKWNVKMTEFDIEVILGIEDHEVTVSLGLTKESLHRRNITHFGPTTLRPTICYNMLR